MAFFGFGRVSSVQKDLPLAQVPTVKSKIASGCFEIALASWFVILILPRRR
jgi:hypothetical protein